VNVLSIQSHVAYGHVGNSAAVFTLQRLGIEVWPVHTVQYSNHKGYETWTGQDFTPGHIDEVVDGMAARGAFAVRDAVLSGYVGRAAVGQAILDAVEAVRAARRDALYACDPVMGDDGRGLYVAEDLIEFFRDRALPMADIITPNRFELELLAGCRIESLGDALRAARVALALGPRIVLVTSLRHDRATRDEIDMLAVTAEAAWQVRTPYLALDPMPNGSGDMVAALFLAHYLTTRDPAAALGAAASAVFAVLEATQAAGTRELQLVAAQDRLVNPARRFTAEPLPAGGR
jgi:pyridoxine kinase